MPSYKVAHIHEQGQDMIIVPLEPSFGNDTPATQRATIAQLQMRARAAGLAGTVVPVWDQGGGRYGYIAPPGWHPFFDTIGLDRIFASINKELSW